jgi:alpha-glucosidase (family GH31 glycosyl hydrolase)
LQNIPVFVKEGSFIPTLKNVTELKNTSEYTGKEHTIYYYPSSNQSMYTLFLDDGTTTNTLKSGNFELITFKGKMSDGLARIKVTSNRKTTRSPNLQFIIPATETINQFE